MKCQDAKRTEMVYDGGDKNGGYSAKVIECGEEMILKDELMDARGRLAQLYQCKSCKNVTLV